MSEDKRKGLGMWGEERATQHLVEQGWEVVARNWRVSDGEVDVIARREEPWGDRMMERVIFVEVKTRVTGGRLSPERSVTRAKRERLVRLAKVWQRRYRAGSEVGIRFDVIAVERSRRGEEVEVLRHYEGAFDALGRV